MSVRPRAIMTAGYLFAAVFVLLLTQINVNTHFAPLLLIVEFGLGISLGTARPAAPGTTGRAAPASRALRELLVLRGRRGRKATPANRGLPASKVLLANRGLLVSRGRPASRGRRVSRGPPASRDCRESLPLTAWWTSPPTVTSHRPTGSPRSSSRHGAPAGAVREVMAPSSPDQAAAPAASPGASFPSNRAHR